MIGEDSNVVYENESNDRVLFLRQEKYIKI